MNTTAKDILDLQQLHTECVDLLSNLLKEQFDRRVDITILRILFRENDESIESLGLAMYEHELAYTRLRSIDEQIILLQNKMERLDFALDMM